MVVREASMQDSFDPVLKLNGVPECDCDVEGRGVARLARFMWPGSIAIAAFLSLFISVAPASAQNCSESEPMLRERALESNDPALAERYLDCYQNSEHVLLLSLHLKTLAERQAFDAAIEAGTPGPLIDFIKEYPGSEYKDAALERIAQLRRLFGYAGSRLQGTELVDLPMQETTMCMQACLDRNGCNGFTHFLDERKLCRLWTTVTHHIPDRSAVSGSREAVPEAPVPFINYPGNTLAGRVLQSGRTNDASACQNACANRQDCQGYTYFADRAMCSLWNSVTNRSAESGVTSGARREVMEVMQPQVPSSGSSGFEYYQGVDFSSGDMPGMPIREVSRAVCERGCAASSQCVAYTYNEERRACFLKNRIVSRIQFRGAISAVKTNRAAVPPPQQSALQVFQDVDLENARNSRHDFARRDGIDLATCHSICSADTRCKAYTYNIAAAACFLKSGFIRARQFPGAISGVKQ